jgi:hypothetical protein
MAWQTRFHGNDIHAITRQPPVTTIEVLLEAVLSVGSALRLYSEDPSLAECRSVGWMKWSRVLVSERVQLSSAREVEKRQRYSQLAVDEEFCMGGSDKRTWAWESEEFPLLEAVARVWLSRSQQAQKSHSECYGDSEMLILAVAL